LIAGGTIVRKALLSTLALAGLAPTAVEAVEPAPRGAPDRPLVTPEQLRQPSPAAPAVTVAGDIPASIHTKAVLPIGKTVTGKHEFDGDEDWYRVKLKGGTNYTSVLYLSPDDPDIYASGDIELNTTLPPSGQLSVPAARLLAAEERDGGDAH
jgi:hypothetical protein